VSRAAVVVVLVLAGGTALACAGPSSRWGVTSRGGVSWLVTPCGAPFFSIGVNAVNEGGPPEPVRVPYFWRTTYSDYAAWLAATRARIRGWGFNTAGATSLPPDVLGMPAIPDLQLGLMAGFHWGDPFAPRMGRRMRETARRFVAPYAGSAERIGYFPDNEVGWWNGALFSFYLEKDPRNHTKRKLITLLRRHYDDDWSSFTRDFVPPSGVASFADLLHRPGPTPSLRPGGAGIRVVRRWTAIVAERYYRLVHDALHAADPDALVFSDRLPIYYDPDAVRAMVPYVDVIATNYNLDSPDGWVARYYFDGLRRLSGGKPVLVSEWFFAAHENRSGNRNNGHLMAVETQAERARGAAAAAESFARVPTIVGAHWFQFYDHPRGGRDDGEDYNFGLVDIDDRPYAPLVDAFAAVNPRLAALHRAARAAPATRFAIPRARIDARDRSLVDWPKARALVPGIVAEPGDIPFGDLYLAWDDDGISLAVIGMDYYAPELLPRGVPIPRSEAFHVDWGLDAGGGERRLTLSVGPPRVVSGRADYVMRADLCEMDTEPCAAVPGAVATYFGADQPRITAEVHVPWKALGVDGPPRRALRTTLAVTGFHRGRRMWTDGGWRRVPLARTGSPVGPSRTAGIDGRERLVARGLRFAASCKDGCRSPCSSPSPRACRTRCPT
jgi:hypothetical protein